MFGFFKSFSEKCAIELYRIEGVSRTSADKWLMIFDEHIKTQREEGERKPDFSIAWLAMQHLHKIVDADHPQLSFFASRCPIGTEDDEVNKVSIAICRALINQMGDEMRLGVAMSLEKLDKQN